MKQGGLTRTIEMVQIAAAAGLAVVIGHGFGLTLSTLAEATVAAVCPAVLDGCEAVGPLKMAADVVNEAAVLDRGVIDDAMAQQRPVLHQSEHGVPSFGKFRVFLGP